MLIEMIDNGININGIPKLKDFRLNYESKDRMRAKFKLLGDKEIPIDVVVIHFKFPSFTNHGFKVVGKEMRVNVIFDIEVKFHIVKRIYEINGNVDNVKFSILAKNKHEVFEKLESILKEKILKIKEKIEEEESNVKKD